MSGLAFWPAGQSVVTPLAYLVTFVALFAPGYVGARSSGAIVSIRA